MKQNKVTRQIMWGDLDSLEIVFYPRFYEWIDACGHLFFDHLGINIGELWKRHKIQFGLIETGCKYHQPGRYMDELEIVTQIDALTEKTVRLGHNIYRAADQELLVAGFEQRICMDVSDPERFRAIAIPEAVYGVLEAAAAP